MLRFEDWTKIHRVESLPKPQKTDPIGQHPQQSAYTRAYHLQNFHDKGYETSSVPTNDPCGNTNYHKKQHFIGGMIPGGSQNNKMIYGTDELLRQSEEKRKSSEAGDKSKGFMYGTEAATNVGKQKPSRRPNNALWLEQRVYDDHISQHKKLASEQDDFLMDVRREKQMKLLEKEHEKKQTLEMLKSYKPWGKEGGGAPKKDTRRTKALEQQDRNPIGGRGEGGGAPNRTVSGRPLTILHGDPELRFPNYSEKSDVVPSLRYGKKDKHLGKELENIMDEARERKELRRKQSFDQEIRHVNHNPFGKQGSGAPLKDEKGKVMPAFPTTLSQDICELRNVEPRHPHAYNAIQSDQERNEMWKREQHDPWGKGVGSIVRGKDGKIIRAARPKNDETDGIGITVGRPGAGAPIKDTDGNIRTKKKQTLIKDNYGKAISRDFSPKDSRDMYNPFGKKGGGGAPITDTDGKVRTRLVAKVERDGMESPTTSKKDLLAKQTHLKTLQVMADEAKQKQKNEIQDIKKSGPDTASWLKSGVIGQPKYDPITKEIIATHKQTSDITQQKLNIRRMKNDTSIEYHHQLQSQQEEKQQKRSKEREAEKQTSMQHVNTMNSMFGRPGAGAPLSEGDTINARKQKVGIAPADEIKFRLE